MELRTQEGPVKDLNFEDILDNSKIGLWMMEINRSTGVNKMYYNEVMINLIGANHDLNGEKNFEFWYSRIYKGYYSYVRKAFNKVCSEEQPIEIQYLWKHPRLGDIIVRSYAKMYSKKEDVILIKGYHQNINDLNQMKKVLANTDNEVFEWYQDSNTAYIHTNYILLEKGENYIENFPYCWVESGKVDVLFRNIFLSAFERINEGDKKAVCELKMKNRKGEYSWYRMILSKEELSSRIDSVVIGNIKNIDKLKEMEISYVVESRFYKAILKEMIAYGEINLTDYKFLNTGGLWNFYKEDINNLNIIEIIKKYSINNIHPEDRQKCLDIISYDNLMENYYNNNRIIKCEVRRKISPENIRWIEFTCNLFKEPYKMDILGLFYIKDIDDRKRQEILLKYSSKIDGLTNLYNKNSFKEIVDEIMLDSDENNKFAFCIIDLDDFKIINDTYGHYVGDEVLVYISEKLRQIFMPRYCIARFGGDEFVLFAKNVKKNDLEQRILFFYKELKNFVRFKISCSIGVAISCKRNYMHLFNMADKALYIVKKNGSKGDYHCEQDFEEDNYYEVKEEINQYPLIPIEESIDKNYTNIDEVISAEGNIAYIIDPSTYKILEANSAFYRILNKQPKECEGLECYKILHNKSKPCSFCKNIFWNSNSFFVWKRYNKYLKEDFILKNKLIKFNGKNAMFTLATPISNNEEMEGNNFSKNISNLILSSIYQLSKKESFESNIKILLELITEFFNAECTYMFNLDGNNKIEKNLISSNEHKYEIQNKLLSVIENELSYNPLNAPKYISCKQEAISISYNLYNIIQEYNLNNMLIFPLKEINHTLGYIICVDMCNFEEYDYLEKLEDYSKNISYLLTEELFKNNLIRKLKNERTYDSLTGLLSRNDYIQYEREYNKKNIESIGVICLALNELNNINHTAGILAGDEILLILSNMLREQFYEDSIFRLNGNEFLVVIDNIDYEYFLNKIENFVLKLEKVGLSITYGKVWSSEEKELYKLVNHAIYLRKKESNKNSKLYSFNNVYKINKLLKEVEQDIEKKKFEIFLQPKISLKTDNLCGAEALIRKRGEDGAYIPPDKFIPLLESNYLIQYIDLFVFEEVFKQMEKWKQEGKELFPISLNFSKRTLLEEDILKTVERIKSKYSIDPKYIEIEVTESIGDLEKDSIYIVLKRLKDFGFLILLDDFGVKYSNITILSDIEFHGLKLDKSIVDKLGENPTKEIITKNIISMCRDLNIKTIAEGVETKEQEDILKIMGCNMVQGYLYSKPISVDEFIKLYF